MERRILLTPEEDQRLQQRAGERGMSAEELVRDAVRRVIGTGIGGVSDNDREEARQAWAHVMAIMRARAGLPVMPEDRGRGRGWTREEFYDERPRHLAG
jgi:hypothetical protein